MLTKRLFKIRIIYINIYNWHDNILFFAWILLLTSFCWTWICLCSCIEFSAFRLDSLWLSTWTHLNAKVSHSSLTLRLFCYYYLIQVSSRSHAVSCAPPGLVPSRHFEKVHIFYWVLEVYTSGIFVVQFRTLQSDVRIQPCPTTQSVPWLNRTGTI